MKIEAGCTALVVGVCDPRLIQNVGRVVRVTQYARRGDVLDGGMIMQDCWVIEFVGGAGLVMATDLDSPWVETAALQDWGISLEEHLMRIDGEEERAKARESATPTEA